MRRGQRVAQERQYGRPRSFADIVQQEPALRALTRRATMPPQRRQGDVWRRIEKVATWTVVAVTLLLLGLIFTPGVMQAIRS